MNDDVLRRAARALREREGGEPPAHRATKDEVLRALAPAAPAPPARRALRPFVTLAAALALSTAWAAAAGVLPSLRQAVTSALGYRPEAPTLTPEVSDPPPTSYAARAAASARSRASSTDAPDAPDAPSNQAAPPAPAPAPAPIARASGDDAPPGPGEWFAPAPPPAPPAPTTPAPHAPSPPRVSTPTPPPAPTATQPPTATTPAPAPSAASPRAPASARAPRPSAAGPNAATAPSAAPPPAPSAAAPDADELYERAHRAHFSGRDPAAALAAWNDYLAAAPRGRFALEARYNRALALSRLGRRDEAARALEPFAAGDFGGYRRDEAQRLLRTLRPAE